ncbi:zinc-binding dehydrogenase [Frankia sp. AgB1.9]|uniref:zinc-binding dehydrogenase n=1 Tax=unclassified Frankia TaxID=2632575 RepID=UPI001933B2C8|nr:MULTISPECIES: zinc-binding dehydrogenase [unclassified Frankia]MBL7492871.1 zinc-binding dehydrogenase [Frankia sp. AgW1.1]MBL7551220.1 zinc-binding dehydrogenase [Frankia sp. AgB1.9]MBL7622756.1 zinc-binding dehydrogenase [Frankia sp. AgB1.8]
MRSLVVDPAAPAGLRVEQRPEPTAGPGQVLIQVDAVSLVDRDLEYAPRMLGAGGVWGFDAAGTVVATGPGRPGSALTPGTRVATLLSAPGAWSELVVSDAADVAALPAGVDAATATAAALPGVSAVQAIRAGAPRPDQHVLVTGASGGVGWYAVQLAALAGARVTALVRDPGDAAALRGIGAASVVTDAADVAGPVDLAIDIVGGAVLAAAVALLGEGGVALAVGAISGEATLLAPDLLASPARRRVQGFWGQWPLGGDLRQLAELIAGGRLRPAEQPSVSWHEVGELAAGYRAGTIRRRRVVLRVD